MVIDVHYYGTCISSQLVFQGTSVFTQTSSYSGLRSLDSLVEIDEKVRELYLTANNLLNFIQSRKPVEGYERYFCFIG